MYTLCPRCLYAATTGSRVVHTVFPACYAPLLAFTATGKVRPFHAFAIIGVDIHPHTGNYWSTLWSPPPLSAYSS